MEHTRIPAGRTVGGITIVRDDYSCDLIDNNGALLAAGIATRQDAEDRRSEILRAR